MPFPSLPPLWPLPPPTLLPLPPPPGPLPPPRPVPPPSSPPPYVGAIVHALAVMSGSPGDWDSNALRQNFSRAIALSLDMEPSHVVIVHVQAGSTAVSFDIKDKGDPSELVLKVEIRAANLGNAIFEATGLELVANVTIQAVTLIGISPWGPPPALPPQPADGTPSGSTLGKGNSDSLPSNLNNGSTTVQTGGDRASDSSARIAGAVVGSIAGLGVLLAVCGCVMNRLLSPAKHATALVHPPQPGTTWEGTGSGSKPRVRRSRAVAVEADSFSPVVIAARAGAEPNVSDVPPLPMSLYPRKRGGAFAGDVAAHCAPPILRSSPMVPSRHAPTREDSKEAEQRARGGGNSVSWAPSVRRISQPVSSALVLGRFGPACGDGAIDEKPPQPPVHVSNTLPTPPPSTPPSPPRPPACSPPVLARPPLPVTSARIVVSPASSIDQLELGC